MRTAFTLMEIEKTIKRTVLIAAATVAGACNPNTMNTHKHTNQLIREQSPYLLQHAHNPVDWRAWNPSVLTRAQSENKLLLISIGYSTCHWCHVMERETFEDELAADTMNALFINIKIDREERPDLDQIYMQALQLMTRQGGWPLNIIALPDGRPVWGTTYLPKERWLESLSAVAKVYRESPEEVIAYAEKLQKGVQASLWVHPDEEGNPLDANATLALMLEGWQTRIDTQYGGPNRAPKFMMPENFRFLLHYGHVHKNDFWKKYVHLSLSRMLMGGIYDHVGGGFARYSTDIRWKVPHFEKMLYDNGQMLSLLADAYRESKNPRYKTAMRETVEFLHREMRAPDGGFYSALDADSEGEEGLFYVWTGEELKELLGADYGLFADFYRVGQEGFWEHGRNILLHLKPPEKFAERHHLAVADFLEKQQTWKNSLLTAREKRIRPERDEKIIAGWNALAIEGLLDVWAATQLPKAKKLAEDALGAFEKFDHPDGGLWHVRTLKKTYLPAYLDDYALATSAYLKAFSVLGDEAYLSRAVQLTEFVLHEFSAEGSPLLLYRPLDTTEVFAASQEVEDNVIPASNSTMAQNLFLLSRIEGRMDWAERSLAMLAAMQGKMPSYGEAYARWARVMMMHSRPFYEVAFTGPKAQGFAQEWQGQYHPHTVVAFSEKESGLQLFKNRYSSTQTRIFACENARCLRPVESVEEGVGMVSK